MEEGGMLPEDASVVVRVTEFPALTLWLTLLQEDMEAQPDAEWQGVAEGQLVTLREPQGLPVEEGVNEELPELEGEPLGEEVTDTVTVVSHTQQMICWPLLSSQLSQCLYQ